VVREHPYSLVSGAVEHPPTGRDDLQRVEVELGDPAGMLQM